MTIDEAKPLADAWLAWFREPPGTDYPLSGEEHVALLSTVHARMLEYVKHSICEGFPDGLWDRESMADWIACDLYGSDEEDLPAIVSNLCEAAKWPTKGEATEC